MRKFVLKKNSKESKSEYFKDILLKDNKKIAIKVRFLSSKFTFLLLT